MPQPARRKDDVIQIRASAEAKAILNRAAAIRGQKLSEFMLECARRQAEDTIFEQRTFFLDEDTHLRFLALLELTAEPVRQGARPVQAQAAVEGMSAAAAPFRAPEPLAPRHDISRFLNGVHPSLDQWLRERARSSERLSARTYVLCTTDEPDRVAGYFSISAAIEQRTALPSAKLRRGMPEHVSLLLIGRLAVAAEYKGRGLGSALLVDALQRLAASEIAGVRGIVAHAIDDAAVGFYERHGFIRCPLGERVMLMPIETVRSLLAK